MSTSTVDKIVCLVSYAEFQTFMWTSSETEQRVLAIPESVHGQSLPHLLIDDCLNDAHVLLSSNDNSLTKVYGVH